MKYLFFLLLLSGSIFASAQSKYKPGYVVTLNGDTVKGYIDYLEWGNNPKTISFKKNETAQKELYTIDNTTAFGVKGNEKYRRETVWLSQDRVDMGNLRTVIDT